MREAVNSVLAVVAEMVPFFTTVTALSPEGVYEFPWAFTCDAVGAVDALATTRKYAVPISSSATPIVAESTRRSTPRDTSRPRDRTPAR